MAFTLEKFSYYTTGYPKSKCPIYETVQVFISDFTVNENGTPIHYPHYHIKFDTFFKNTLYWVGAKRKVNSKSYWEESCLDFLEEKFLDFLAHGTLLIIGIGLKILYFFLFYNEIELTELLHRHLRILRVF